MQKRNKLSTIFETRRSVLILLLIAVLVTAISLKIFGTDKENPADGESIFLARRGPLRISITESGTIKAREQVIINNEVEGRTTILSIIPEGTSVKKGDLLIELDASQLVDQRIDQQINVENADAAYVRAFENLAVVENQAESDVDKAELTLEFAKLDLEKYIEGEYPNQLTEAKSKIKLAQEELQRAEETLKWSKRLFEGKYISQTELQSDELAASKKQLDVDLAQNNLKLLEEFTYERELAQLESDVKQAEMALERTNRKARADVIQAKADLRAKESELNRQKDKLAKNEAQIEKTRIVAPADGLVIYATSARGNWRGNEEPLDEGQEVRERQELIYLPTATAVKAEIKVHEASLDKITESLPAIITVDAVPGKIYYGNVTKIAPLPDAQSVWLNPDLKVYDTEIFIEGDGSMLRTGMSCRAEIIVKDIENTVYVPVQAVLRVDGKPTVYVKGSKGFEPRVVEVGLDNNRMIQIVSGLEEDEPVWLTPPLAPAEVRQFEGKNGYPEVDSTESVDMPVMPETQPDQPQGRQRDSRRGGAGGGQQGSGRSRPSGSGRNLSPEQMQQMRERFENMSDEEKEQMRKRFMQNQQQQTQDKE